MRTVLRSLPTIFLYALPPASLLLLVYLFQPYTAQVSLKWIGVLAALSLGFLSLTWVQVRFWIAPLWRLARNREKIIWIILAIALGALCFSFFTPARILILEKFPLFAPWERLEVRPLLATGENLSIQRIKIYQRQVPSSSLSLQGAWKSPGLSLSTTDPAASLTLTAHVPREVDILFQRSPDAGRAVVSWAGKQESIDLKSDEMQGTVYTFNFNREKLPPATSWIRLLTLPAWIGIAFAATGVLFISPSLPSPTE
jgi:hypothetical protein